MQTQLTPRFPGHNRAVGISMWLSGGLAAFLVARAIPLGRGTAWLGELATAIVIALLLGVLATALDFGGWQEPDWRAATFAFLGAFAAVGMVRVRSSLRFQ